MMKLMFNRVWAVLFFAFITFNLSAADVKVGETLFKGNCASCHNKNMKDPLTGPALGGAQGRWSDQKKLYAWIRNSAAVIASGDSYANQLYNTWNKTAMTAFPNLKDDEIASILEYVDGVYTGKIGGAPAAAAGGATAGVEAADSTSNVWYILAAAFLGLLVFFLARTIGNLNVIASEKDGLPLKQQSWSEVLTSRGVMALLAFGLIVLGGYTTVNNAISLGRQQNYAPEQPIKFSHARHSGIHKIECQYCHDGARRSKQSLIPAANTCMNCHRAIKNGSTYGTAELTKIFASIGYDPSSDKYIENYDKMSQEDIANVYKKWIGDQYIAKNKSTKLDEDGARLVDDQWKGVVASLTNEDKKVVQGPIEWVRIHNLPDHAYFNHAQHVSVGKVACQQCHGPVEKMAVMKQYAPLSMGWCINCHRETEVKFVDNKYYDNYKRYHDEMKAGKREKVTVEDVGGLECQKCHY
jgi:mono/diheme cytochrome c family protein